MPQNNSNFPKVYRATVTQSGASAPVVTVLENSLGNLVWTRLGVGIYRGTLVNAFVVGAAKCWIMIGSQNTLGFVLVQVTSTDTVSVSTYSDLLGTAIDTVLTDCPMEIRVYA